MNQRNLVHLSSWDPEVMQTLFASLSPYLLQVESALIGTTPCALFVDSAESPRTAALQIEQGWTVVGHPTAAFLEAVNRRLPRDSYSVLHLDPSITPDERDVLFEGLYFVRARSRYAERTVPIPVMHPLPSPYEMVAVDRNLLSSAIEGVGDLNECIIQNWRSLEAFEAQGFGFAVCLIRKSSASR